MPKAMVASQKAYMAHTTHRSTYYILTALVEFETYENIVSYLVSYPLGHDYKLVEHGNHMLHYQV